MSCSQEKHAAFNVEKIYVTSVSCLCIYSQMGVKQIQMFHVTHAQCQYKVPKWLGSDLHICINIFFFLRFKLKD